VVLSNSLKIKISGYSIMSAPVIQSLLSSGDSGVDLIDVYINQIIPDEIKYMSHPMPDVSYTLVCHAVGSTVDRVKGTVAYKSTVTMKESETDYTNSYLTKTNPVAVGLQVIFDSSPQSYEPLQYTVKVLVDGVEFKCKYFTTVLSTKYYVLE
jgi:hypothetical protein